MRIACSENWQSGPENTARGAAWLDTIYKHNRTNTMKPMESHKDFGKYANSFFVLSSPFPLLLSNTASFPKPFFHANPTSLDHKEYHLWPLSLRPQYPQRSRYGTGGAFWNHDSELAA